jgi:hypothetical protein
MRKAMARWLLLLVGVSLVLGGVIYLGRLAVEELRRHDHYRIRFADILCEPPPGMTRADFLDEVQYLSNFRAEIRPLDSELPQRLAEAFATHPWVEAVERVEVADIATIKVSLRFRSPVLAVPWDGQLRAVDAGGVLLPGDAGTDGLPVFTGTAQPPRGAAGTTWGDERVLAAARAAAQKR